MWLADPASVPSCAPVKTPVRSAEKSAAIAAGREPTPRTPATTAATTIRLNLGNRFITRLLGSAVQENGGRGVQTGRPGLPEPVRALLGGRAAPAVCLSISGGSGVFLKGNHRFTPGPDSAGKII